MSKKNDVETINALQNDNDYIVLSNPLASPKFVRMIGKDKEMTINDTYTPKIFYEIVSRLTPEDLNGIKENQNIRLDININQFLKDIGANNKNYKHLITSIEALQTILFKWKENGLEHRSSIINYSIHDPKSGKVQVQIHEKMVRHILEVKQKENFSFLKSNIFRLQNAQAIRLYPFFEKWLNYGRYITDLERFKNDFGYNTSGYTRFSLLKQKVLEPAITEINEKTNLLVSYEPTGDNLESQRPRIKGLIFVIKSKDKPTKAIEQKSANQEQKPQREKTQQNELSTLYTIFTSLKFEATARLPRETAEATIMQWVDKNGYDAVFNGFMRAKDTYKSEIKNPIGFFSGNYFKEYKDYIKQKEEAKEEQKRVKEEQEHKEQQARTLKIILDDFKKREFEYFIKLYNDQSEEIQQAYIEEVKKNPMYFDHKNRTITKIGAMFVGQKIAETTEYNPRKTLQNLAQRDYDTKIMFDQDGKPFIQEGLFDEQPQEQTEPPQAIETAALPTVPPLTTPLPHAQEQTEPNPSDFSAQSNNKDLEETAEPVEDVEAPKNIKSLFGKWFK